MAYWSPNYNEVNIVGGKGSGGNGRKPIERKLRIGAPNRLKPIAVVPANIVALPMSHVPEPHRVLSDRSQKLWAQVWTSGAGWLKQNMDTELVLMLCEATDERQTLRRRLVANPDAWRDRLALRQVDAQVIKLLDKIGFTPSERALFGTGETAQNGFSDLHRRIAEKRAASK